LLPHRLLLLRPVPAAAFSFWWLAKVFLLLSYCAIVLVPF